MAVAALVVSIAAVLLAGLGAWSAYRSARSSESSAHSAAQAVDLERARRHDELTPHILLERDGALGGEDERVWFANDGPSDYDRVGFAFASTTRRPPVDGLLVDDEWATVGEVGPLALGERRPLRLRRAEDREDAILRLRITCSNEQGTWPILAEVEIPGIPEVY
jgi:ABC-type nickel/cobalt efflux system permease component RcnA